jgi:hypothetical protein
VCMSVVLRGAKKLRVNTAFGGILTAAGTGTGLVDFCAVCEISLEICFLHLFTSGSRHPGPLNPLRFCSLHHSVLPMNSY